MRGRDDPHVDVDGRLASDALDLMVLQHAEQPHLGGKRQFADLVEKERAAIGPLEPALMLLSGSRKTPLLMAEQLGIDQFGGNRPAVDPDEGAVGPLRPRMNRPRHHLLAGARLAEDQHGEVRRGDEFHPLHDVPEARPGADDVLVDVLSAEP